ncbi:hypothetical protein L2E82_44565 [Cichorium intybus]|uniref:Uncharacterized protein n=1 Tax=Cichorium intybus TaxID=13427 RepID=A0ACB8ZV05_CICIN|nr:hypothetical protein L2E82_44565 [Cichorium intybus]
MQTTTMPNNITLTVNKSIQFFLLKSSRYRYDRRANPYNRGVLENFGEIFCTSILVSKNKFRALVPKEPGLGTRPVGGGFVSPNMGKAVADIEMGRKAVSGNGG